MKIRGTTITTPLARSAVADDTSVSKKPWSSQNTVDKLCPAFTESGAIVACEPVEGYPLAVTAQEGATAITRAGRNLFSDIWKDWSNWTDGRIILHLPPGDYCVWGERTAGIYVYLEKSTDGGATWTSSIDTKFMTSNDSKVASFTVTNAEGEMWSIWTSSKYFKSLTHLQIEVGSTKTIREDYKGETFALGDTVQALPGVNTLWANTGNITVTGRTDPVAENAMLKSRLAALEAALINT